ncbi:MAG: hypothetical protein ACK4ZJ_01440 [Allorhizobium sp.]
MSFGEEKMPEAYASSECQIRLCHNRAWVAGQAMLRVRRSIIKSRIDLRRG